MPITQLFALPALKQKAYTIGDVAFRMINLPGQANFVMGNNKGEEESSSWERPKHTRVVSPFALAEFPVTQKLWKEVVARARVKGLLEEQTLPLSPAYFSGKNRPVEKVNWHEAGKFCEVLSLLIVGKADFFRLPSETEWEYAARAGTRKQLYAGSNQLAEVGWNSDNSSQETVPIGLHSPNNLGLHDLSGNVLEWCEDDWHDNYENHPDGSMAWKDGETKEERAEFRVRRGGSWNYVARDCRCAFRFRFGPDNRSQYGGFRLATPVQE